MNTVIKRTITGSILLIISYGIYACWHYPLMLTTLLITILGIILVTEWPRLLNHQQTAFWLITPFYPLLPFILLINLNHQPHYRGLIPFIIMICFSFDTGSYCIGKLWGQHPIAPITSPGKTWEGFMGGFIITCIIMALWFRSIGKNLPGLYLYSVLLVICVTALCGDLFESWLKRRAAIKDSGTVLPGHGGLLDRFDGILFVTILFYVYKDTLMSFM